MELISKERGKIIKGLFARSISSIVPPKIGVTGRLTARVFGDKWKEIHFDHPATLITPQKLIAIIARFFNSMVGPSICAVQVNKTKAANFGETVEKLNNLFENPPNSMQADADTMQSCQESKCVISVNYAIGFARIL